MKTNPEHPNVAEIWGFRGRIEENTDLIRSTDFTLLFSLEGQVPYPVAVNDSREA